MFFYAKSLSISKPSFPISDGNYNFKSVYLGTLGFLFICDLGRALRFFLILTYSLSSKDTLRVDLKDLLTSRYKTDLPINKVFADK